MNNFAEIVRVGIITGLGVVLMIMALLIANGNSFLTKGMNKKYTNESVRDYCKSNCLGQIIFSLGLILEGIFSKVIFAFNNASSTTPLIASICILEATSGTTPPYCS